MEFSKLKCFLSVKSTVTAEVYFITTVWFSGLLSRPDIQG